jgi:short-subunit dehydrogenase
MTTRQHFSGQVAVVTGASSGIGRALALELAQHGCRVGLLARRRDALESLAREIRESGGTAAVAAADVSHRDQTLAAIRQLARDLGPVDLLVANAGIGWSDALDPLSVERIEEMVRINLLGVVYSIEAVLPEMLSRGRGHIAAVSSIAAYKSFAGSAGYCATKAAVNSFLEGIRVQLHGSGVAVTTICPGFVRTAMTAENAFYMPGLLDADEAARRMVRALSRRRKVINVPRRTAWMVKLGRWIPDGLLARWLPRKGDPGPAPDSRAAG